MWLIVGALALGQDALSPGAVRADPETHAAIGVQWEVTGDDDRDAVVSVRFREVGTTPWRDGPPLFRVEPDTVVGWTVPEQVAGSVFDLPAGRTWEVELHAVDPDGTDETVLVEARTRPWPADPASPRLVPVSSGPQLAAALADAAPGDVIELAAGTYDGTFAIYADGTPTDPIVIRGVDRDAVVLDGGGYGGNVLEVYGSHTQVRSLTLRNANRALRFQGEGAVGNAILGVLATDVGLGFGGDVDQRGFTVCDNELRGPLSWPHVYTDDGGAQANVDGIVVFGSGHAVCHNRLDGWGDALKMGQDGGRAVDFYGNDVRASYDNAIELDGGEGNVRAWRNRITNAYAPISFQPVLGGPAYAVRNLVANVAHENLKFHSLGGTRETSGILVWHNTFVRPHHALKLNDDTTSHAFEVVGNLFVGPFSPDGDRTVEWTGGIDRGRFDGNGWWPPDARFDFGPTGDWPDLDATRAAGVFEATGVALDDTTFEGGFSPAADYTTEVDPPDLALTAGPAVDGALPIPGVNDDFLGSGPDLGALERGCPVPTYGPRAPGADPGAAPEPCTPGGTDPPGDTGAPGGGTGTKPASDGGCGCGVAGTVPAGWVPAALGAAALRRRRVDRRAIRRG